MCCIVLCIVTAVLVHSAPSVTVVLANSCLWGGLMTNSGFHRQCSDSCARLGTASRVALTGVRVWSSSIRRSRVRPCLFEGPAEGGALEAQAPTWRCPVSTGRHSVRGGRTVPEMAEKMCSAHSAQRRCPDCVCGRHPYTLRGCSHALSRGSSWEKGGSRRQSVLE
jgi:hypothetical protein